MSEQEMQFANPDWQPSQAGTPTVQALPRPINDPAMGQRTPPALQARQSAVAGEQGYNGYAGVEYAEIDEQAPQQHGYLRPQPRRRRSPPWLGIGIVVLALIFVVGLAQGYQGFNANHGFDHFGFRPRQAFNMSASKGEEFNVGSNPTVNVVDPNGSINVTSGDSAGIVVVQSAGNIPGQGEPIVQTSQAIDGTLTVTVINPGAFPASAANIQIIVPTNANLTLNTGSGDIAITDVSGQLTLNSGSGSIELDGVTLQQHSSIQTDSGNINFSGAIDAQGTYQLISNSGAITVGLDGAASYRLHVITRAGAFTSNGSATTSPPAINKQIIVGNNPQASLTLQTKSGDITLSP